MHYSCTILKYHEFESLNVVSTYTKTSFADEASIDIANQRTNLCFTYSFLLPSFADRLLLLPHTPKNDLRTLELHVEGG